MSILEDIRAGKKDIVEYTEECIGKARNLDREFHYFTAIAEESALAQAKAIRKNFSAYKGGKLLGVMLSAKDAICVRGVESCAGSRILKGYKPLFDATAIARIKKEGGIIIGKTSQDEFGFGSFSVNVGLGFKVPL